MLRNRTSDSGRSGVVFLRSNPTSSELFGQIWEEWTKKVGLFQKTLGDFSENVGDFPKKLGVFLVQLSDFFVANCSKKACSLRKQPTDWPFFQASDGRCPMPTPRIPTLNIHSKNTIFWRSRQISPYHFTFRRRKEGIIHSYKIILSKKVGRPTGHLNISSVQVPRPLLRVLPIFWTKITILDIITPQSKDFVVFLWQQFSNTRLPQA